MSDSQEDSKNKSFIDRITDQFFHDHEFPENKEELVEQLHIAHERKLFNADALRMLEGVLGVSELRAEDIMVPRAQMKVIDISDQSQDWIRYAIESGHSRFPAVDGDKDNVVGILLAKDLLRLFENPEYKILEHLREAVFVPESKPVDVLLKEFRMKRNHMALVVDEFGSISGLITIEDVLEEIVGEIDDEYDIDETVGNIVSTGQGKWRVKASTHIEDFNEYFNTHFEDDRYESVGGLVSDELEHVPHIGEEVELDGIRFKVLKAADRQVQLFAVERVDFESNETKTEI
ncbi:MAG: CBS domain-containing protein [Burkholderiaceae bacterium]|nr:CBS domain-containing protein [Burkholderiaceae bacterium]